MIQDCFAIPGNDDRRKYVLLFMRHVAAEADVILRNLRSDTRSRT